MEKTEKTPKPLRRIWLGKVVSKKNDQTIIVEVERVKIHPIYQKKYLVTKRYSVDDPNNTFQVGQKVKFVECRPISKTKHHVVLDRQ